MKKTSPRYLIATILGLLLSASLVSAQSMDTNPPVEIKNDSGEERKICMHKPDLISLFAIGCVTLKNGENIFWNRKGVFTDFKVKVYETRKILDKYLYARDLPADTGKIIIGRGKRFGFSRFKNITTKYVLRVCNTKYPGGVYFVLGFETNYGTWAEGWWNVDKGKCINLPVSKRLKEKHNIPYGTIPRLFYYARTYYGDESLYWRGGDGDTELCVNTAKRFDKLQYIQDGTAVKTRQPCTAENEALVKFRRLEDPREKQDFIYLTF